MAMWCSTSCRIGGQPAAFAVITERGARVRLRESLRSVSTGRPWASTCALPRPPLSLMRDPALGDFRVTQEVRSDQSMCTQGASLNARRSDDHLGGDRRRDSCHARCRLEAMLTRENPGTETGRDQWVGHASDSGVRTIDSVVGTLSERPSSSLGSCGGLAIPFPGCSGRGPSHDV
jgi:hypothetical protein